MITQETLDRINELARKAKTTGLTPKELAERDTLRRAYLDAVKASLTAQLDNTYVVAPDGSKRRLSKKD